MYDRGAIMSEEERLEIYNWCISIIRKIPTIFNNRKNYYFNYGDENNTNNDIVLLDKIYEIQKRIEDKENLHGFEKPKSLPDFIAMVLYDGFIHGHTDKNDTERELIHVRFNVFINVPKFNTYYAGNIIDAVPGSYVLCRSGIDWHYSDVNTELSPRTALSFGYLLPKWKMDELCKEKKELYGIYL